VGGESTALNALTFNAGSSSLKFGVYAVEGERVHRLQVASVKVEPTAQASGEATRAAAAQVHAWGIEVGVVGHRAVFGGNDDHSTAVTPALLDRLERLAILDPLHAPGAIACLREASQRFPGLPQVVCFDTAFFHDLPEAVRRLPIPVGDDALLRRYGFHGLSYEYVRRLLGDALGDRAIVAHLGSGASLAALRNGSPVDTTMGFSSLGGVLMASRPGDLDPGVLLYLLEESGLSVAELRTKLETASGLRAIANGEGDLQVLLDRPNDGPSRAAVAAFVASVAKSVGALSVTLGGLDTLVFTGGIGEHLPEIRARIVAAIEHLGVSLDGSANAAGTEVISTPTSRVVVRVAATDENATIARQAAIVALDKR
jgi:acetate kinase